MFNFYQLVKQKTKFLNPQYEATGFKIPFRMCISSASGTGKSNLCINIIHALNKSFHKIVLCVKSADEPLYQFLKEKLDNKVQIFENGDIAPLIEDTEETDKNIVRGGYRLSKLIIFDDLYLENKAVQERIKQFYIRGRKFGYSCIYISQNFYGIPLDIRKNSNILVLGRGLLSRDLKMILSSVAGSSDKSSLHAFESAYKRFTAEEMSVCIIDVEKKIARNNIYLKELKEEDVFMFE